MQSITASTYVAMDNMNILKGYKEMLEQQVQRLQRDKADNMLQNNQQLLQIKEKLETITRIFRDFLELNKEYHVARRRDQHAQMQWIRTQQNALVLQADEVIKEKVGYLSGSYAAALKQSQIDKRLEASKMATSHVLESSMRQGIQAEKYLGLVQENDELREQNVRLQNIILELEDDKLTLERCVCELQARLRVYESQTQ